MIKYSVEFNEQTSSWEIIELYRASPEHAWVSTVIDVGTDPEDAQSLAAAYSYIEKNYEQ